MRVTQAMGELGGLRFVPVLVRMLDDRRTSVSLASLASRPKATGHDVGDTSDSSDAGTAERIRRWKQWQLEGAK